MEEDKLEIYIENYNNLRKGKDHINSIDKDFFFDFVDMLIKAYKELKEIEQIHRQENGELREKVKELEECLEVTSKALGNVAYDQIPIVIADLMIPTSLVKEKIEELKQEYKIALEENSTKAFILKCQIEALEELLEKRKGNGRQIYK